MKSKRSESTPPKESRQKIIPLTRCCVETLREQERPVDCGDTLGRFQRRGLARARAASHERIGGAGRYRRGGRAPRRRTAREGFRRRERFANEKKVSDEPKDYHRCTYLQGAPPAAWTAAGRRLAYSHNMSSAVAKDEGKTRCQEVRQRKCVMTSQCRLSMPVRKGAAAEVVCGGGAVWVCVRACWRGQFFVKRGK